MSGSDALVTLGICVKDAGRTLPRTMDSVCRQDYPDMEVMVVIGKCEDDTPNIIRFYGMASRWPYFIFNTKTGLAPARAEAIYLYKPSTPTLND